MTVNQTATIFIIVVVVVINKLRLRLHEKGQDTSGRLLSWGMFEKCEQTSPRATATAGGSQCLPRFGVA